MKLLVVISVVVSSFFSPKNKAVQEIIAIKEQMKAYYSTDLDSAALLAQMILNKSKEANYSLGQAKGEFAIAYITYKQGYLGKSIPHFLDALDLYLPINTRESLIDQANICITLGQIYWYHHSHDAAIEFYDKGIALAQRADDNEAIVKLIQNKAMSLRRIGKMAESTKLLVELIDIIPESNIEAKHKTYNQLGLIYNDLQEYDQARRWFDKMIQLDSDVPSLYRGRAFHNIASSYKEQKNYNKARAYYERSIEAYEGLGNSRDFFLAYRDLAELALLENSIDLCKIYSEKAKSLLDEVPRTPEHYDLYHILSKCLQASQPEEAFKYRDQYVSENESFLKRQHDLIAAGEKYKVQLITSNYFNKVKRQEDRLRLAWTMSCAVAFIFLAVLLTLKLYRIYSYRSPELALSHIKSQNEMIYLLDLFRKEKEEMKNTLRQKE
ncbi:MAG: tetratricopeptide repeat protein [Reichenbachiella sp.]|uniref:tetratricopeptide repeat protein n=1 Tax=Reichenbachiella sp. TaxID=2184521 RepID=UPI003263A162